MKRFGRLSGALMPARRQHAAWRDPAYSCDFSFRVPTGTKVARLTIDETSFDLTAWNK